MSGFTFNKIAGAVLATLLFGFFVIEVSHRLYPNPREAEHAEHMGYPVPGMEDGHGGGDTVVETPEVSLPTLLASADVAAGEAQFRACASCHNDAPGAGNKVGPNLWGVVGRAIGGGEGFNYSGAMGSHGGTWTFESLSAFLEAPSDFIPGTAMSYRGMRRAGDRANLIAYLNQQSDSPLALPAISEAPGAAEEAATEAVDAVHDAAAETVGEAADAMESAAEDAAEAIADEVPAEASADPEEGDGGH